MSQVTRYRCAVISYWLLFIIGPAVAIFFLIGTSVSNAGMCLGLGAVLVIIGERGFRPWKRFWKVGPEKP